MEEIKIRDTLERMTLPKICDTETLILYIETVTYNDHIDTYNYKRMMGNTIEDVMK